MERSDLIEYQVIADDLLRRESTIFQSLGIFVGASLIVLGTLTAYRNVVPSELRWGIFVVATFTATAVLRSLFRERSAIAMDYAFLDKMDKKNPNINVGRYLKGSIAHEYLSKGMTTENSDENSIWWFAPIGRSIKGNLAGLGEAAWCSSIISILTGFLILGLIEKNEELCRGQLVLVMISVIVFILFVQFLYMYSKLPKEFYERFAKISLDEKKIKEFLDRYSKSCESKARRSKKHRIKYVFYSSIVIIIISTIIHRLEIFG